MKCKTSFLPLNKKNVSRYWKRNLRNEANKDLSLGILGLNESFVQLNEIMDY